MLQTLWYVPKQYLGQPDTLVAQDCYACIGQEVICPAAKVAKYVIWTEERGWERSDVPASEVLQRSKSKRKAQELNSGMCPP